MGQYSYFTEIIKPLKNSENVFDIKDKYKWL